jgi:hypothetical protein
LAREIAANRRLFTDQALPTAGLGLRGFEIEVMDDETAKDTNLPTSYYLAVRDTAPDSKSTELVERLIALIERGEPVQVAKADAPALEADFVSFLQSALIAPTRTSVTDTDAQAGTAAPEVLAPIVGVTCTIELGRFNPGFWNDNATTRYNNNCYNYASNWRTNTFAQPGRGSGSMYTSITCPEVSRAALSDGMHRRFECFPDSEKPRYLVALVVAPGPVFIDYHWYRKQLEGFWGHKPGSTAARNIDNSGRVITDPQTCDRGPYTQFCGFFYGCNTQRQRIR